MSQVVEWFGDSIYPVDGIVTGIWPLADWRKALTTASAGPRARCVKAVLRPTWICP